MSHQRPSTTSPFDAARSGRRGAETVIDEVDSQLLLGSSKRVLIRHHGQTYQLRETRHGKLILTK